MAVFRKYGRIAAAAGAVALLSVEAALLESPKAVAFKREAEEQPKRAAVAAAVAEETTKKQALLSQQEVAKAASRPSSKAPKMAPQFDGLNFYETFIRTPSWTR